MEAWEYAPTVEEIFELHKKYYAPSTVDSRISVRKRYGVLVEDWDGRRFVDFHCDAGVRILGGRDGMIDSAIIHHVVAGRDRFAELHNAPTFEPMMLAKFLVERAPIRGEAAVFFASGGAEINAAAIKACRASRNRSGESWRRKRIYFRNGFAGRLPEVLAATSSKPELQRDPFWTHCDQENTIYLPYPTRENAEELAARIAKIDFYQIDHILIELPCQGEGGIIPVDENVLAHLYHATEGSGVRWIVDAIQCGMGRTGTLFGCEHFSWFRPDMITLGKALGGGFPLSALIARRDLLWEKGEHSNTFGCGALMGRVALVVLAECEKIVRSGRVKKIEDIMQERLNVLRDHPMVFGVRGVGAMWGVEFTSPEFSHRLIRVGEEMATTHDVGLRLLSAGRKTVRLMPPLTITDEELKTALDLLVEAVEITAKEIQEKK